MGRLHGLSAVMILDLVKNGAVASIRSSCTYSLLVLAATLLQLTPITEQKSASGFDSPGWHVLPNTDLLRVCPADQSVHGVVGCKAVISTWNGAAADTKRNRLILWGGGHTDYYGNEVYTLDLNVGRMLRLIDATPNPVHCVETQADGRPSSRHTYDDLAYLAHLDKLFSFGGGLACERGTGSEATWMLDLEKLQWERKDPTVGTKPRGQPGLAVAVYDPNSNLVFVEDLEDLYKYDSGNNTYTKLSSVHGVDYHLSGVIDSKRKLLLFVGAGQTWAINIAHGSNYNLQNWSSKVRGCDGLTNAVYPGLAFDSKQSLIVGWAGGDSVYLFNPDTKVCDLKTFPEGPGRQQENGTHGRFAYFPSLDIFVLVNDWAQNALLLRLSSISSR
jgi:hypothetical protein